MENPNLQYSNALDKPYDIVLSQDQIGALLKRISELETWIEEFNVVGLGVSGEGNQWNYNPELSGEQPEGPEG